MFHLVKLTGLKMNYLKTVRLGKEYNYSLIADNWRLLDNANICSTMSTNIKIIKYLVNVKIKFAWEFKWIILIVRLQLYFSY